MTTTNVGSLMKLLVKEQEQLQQAKTTLDLVEQGIVGCQESIELSVENYMMHNDMVLLAVEDYTGDIWFCMRAEDGTFTMVKAPFVNAGDIKEVPF